MGRFADIAAEVADKTNEELASEISSLTRLKDNEINKLAPAKQDKERLLQLLEIVNSATSENEKAAKLKGNIESLAATAIKLVKVLV